jgi:hypothetical protein
MIFDVSIRRPDVRIGAWRAPWRRIGRSCPSADLPLDALRLWMESVRLALSGAISNPSKSIGFGFSWIVAFSLENPRL